MRVFSRFLVPILAVVCVITACKRMPSPPTVEDAIAVWKNTHKRRHLQDLVSLSKTNGEMEEVNGLKVYTLYYESKEKSVVQLGNSPAGTVSTYQSSYPSEWTEKGWKGPDHKIYPLH